jgi:hypothetical protein
MEWWIIAGLALALGALGIVGRLRKARRGAVERGGKTIYPLW